MKRIVSMLFAALVILSLTPYAAADVAYIETPLKDTFLSLHRDECVEVGKTYYVAEECKAQKSPKNPRTTKVCLQGERICIAWTWKGWGLISREYYKGEYLKKESLGWVEMSYLKKVFTFDDVDKSVYGEVVNDNGGPVKTDKGKYIYFYSFPGSGIISNTAYAGEDLYYDSSWIDPLGRKWGYVGYYYTSKGWVCLDDLYSEDIERIWPECVDDGMPAPPTPAPADVQNALPTAVIALIAAAVAVTSALTVVLIRKNKRNGSKGEE